MVNVFALAADNAADMTFSERLSTAGIVSLQGMLTIFLVLSILWGAVELMHYVLVGRKEKAQQTVQTPVKAASPAPVAESAPAPVAVSDDGAIVAAITAAISAQLASEGFTGGFRVVSFKRAGASTQKRA